MNTPTKKCFDCIHKKNIPGDAHIECVNPRISETDRLITPMILFSGSQNSPAMKRLNVTGDETGIRNGWFLWPLNFDPTWLITCDGFEKKGGGEHETTKER